MRICSLLPSATEILFALGLGDAVAGVTHECDYPPEAKRKRVLVRPRVTGGTAAQVDVQVREFMARGESLYSVDAEALRAIDPDLIVTQDLCHVCAASPDDLTAALARMPRPPRVLSLSPRTLREVWQDIVTVGEATGRAAEAQAVVRKLKGRVDTVQQAVAVEKERPRVACLEWLDPPYCGGHWVPEMVALAGGQDVLGRAGEPSFRVRWEDIVAAQPEVVVVMPCGYGVEQAAAEFAETPLPPGWSGLPAVREGRVYAVDASSYFSRPGPRLANGIEILAQLLHPACVIAGAPNAFKTGAARHLAAS